MKYPSGKEIENWVPIPTEIFEKMGDMGFSPQEWKVFLAILRKTIGYEDGKTRNGQSTRRVTQPLSPKYIEEATGVPERTVRDAYKKFEKMKIISIKKTSFRKRPTTTVTVNENVDEWIPKDILKLFARKSSLDTSTNELARAGSGVDCGNPGYANN